MILVLFISQDCSGPFISMEQGARGCVSIRISIHCAPSDGREAWVTHRAIADKSSICCEMRVHLHRSPEPDSASCGGRPRPGNSKRKVVERRKRPTPSSRLRLAGGLRPVRQAPVGQVLRSQARAHQQRRYLYFFYEICQMNGLGWFLSLILILFNRSGLAFS